MIIITHYIIISLLRGRFVFNPTQKFNSRRDICSIMYRESVVCSLHYADFSRYMHGCSHVQETARGSCFVLFALGVVKFFAIRTRRFVWRALWERATRKFPWQNILRRKNYRYYSQSCWNFQSFPTSSFLQEKERSIKKFYERRIL